MKKYIWIFALLFVLFSCDIVPVDELLKPIENPPTERVVLLEDYTGQRCINCPKAAEEIEVLSSIFGDKLVVVAIHAAGTFSLPAMETPAGDAYNASFFTNAQGYPIGLVNRQKYNDILPVEYTSWGQAIREIIWKKSGITLRAENNFNATESLLNLAVHVDRDANWNNAKLSVQIWLTENKIIAAQQMPDGSVKTDYEHNHVLRDAPNGTWGTPLTFNDNSATYQLTDYSLKDKTWVLENCDIIAFVYNEDTKEVIETIKLPLIVNR